MLGRFLHRKVGRLLALADAIDVADGESDLIDGVRAIGDQAAASDEGTLRPAV